MFDFDQLKLRPSFSSGFDTGATDKQVQELELYCGHKLPENFKFILMNYNGAHPEVCLFDAVDPQTGFPITCELSKFFVLSDNKEDCDNIWNQIDKYKNLLDKGSIPFADDGLEQIYYLKWVNNTPEIWHLSYLDLDEPQNFLVANNFDEMLEKLYV